MKLFLLIFVIFVELKLVFGCIHSKNIECTCDSDVIKCFGSVEDSVQIQDLFSNISLIHSSLYLESLVLNVTNLYSLEDVFFTNLEIKNLTLISSFQNFSENFFSSSFSGLQSLKIQNSKIDNLTNLPFHSQYNLTELSFESNGILRIEPEAFFNLSSLELLSLSKNKLREIDKDFLLLLPLIQTLILNENNISSVSDIQVQSTSLRKLSAQLCNMTGFLEKNSLAGLSNLTSLDLSKNQIKGINSFALSSLFNIKELNLSKNSIEYLEDNAFSKLINLEVLDLSFNKISLIKTTAFNKLSSLKHLDLKSNALRAMLCDYTFDLHSLEKIDLRENRIKTIGAGTFLYSQNIQELFLEGNALDEADATICSPLPNITIMFIDIDLKSKNCEMPDSCGAVLTTTESDYDDDFDDSNVTTTNLNEFTTSNVTTNPLDNGTMEISSLPFDTTEMQSTFLLLNTTPSILFTESTDSSFLNTNASTINLTNSDETTTLDFNSSLVPTTYSEGLIVTEIDSTLDVFSANGDINTTNSEEFNFSDFESTSINTNNSTSDLTTYSNELTNIQTESSSMSTTETEQTESASIPTTEESLTKIQEETESSLAANTSESVSTLSNSKVTYVSTETPIISNKAAIIVSNYTFANTLCFQWTLLNKPSQDHVCIEKHDHCSGRGVKYLKCPESDILIENCIQKNDILKFCLRLLIADVEIDKTCIQPKPFITCKSKSSLPTKLLASSTEATTKTVTTIPTFSNSKRIPTKSYRIPFKVISFDVIFNTSDSGIAAWKVNTNESLEKCNLILILTYVDSHKIEILFSCSNDSYPIKNLNDFQEICLQSHGKAFKTETKCKQIFTLNEANPYKTKDHGYKNSSLFALIILFLVVLTLIIFLVTRNLLKKRFDRDRYNVYIEEQNVQKRSSRLYQEPSVRYSYTPKE